MRLGISSQDQQNYLSNVLGVNQQYGAGLNNMMGYGANAANQISNMYGNMAQGMGIGAMVKAKHKIRISGIC